MEALISFRDNDGAWMALRIVAGRRLQRITQTFHTERLYALGINAAPAKCLNENQPIFVTVVRNEVGIGRDDRTQVIAKCQTDRRAVIQRTRTCSARVWQPWMLPQRVG